MKATIQTKFDISLEVGSQTLTVYGCERFYLAFEECQKLQGKPHGKRRGKVSGLSLYNGYLKQDPRARLATLICGETGNGGFGGFLHEIFGDRSVAIGDAPIIWMSDNLSTALQEMQRQDEGHKEESQGGGE